MTRTPCGLRGTGSAVPERILDNEAMARLVDTSDEWIVQRTGIKERRIVAEDQSTSDLCIEASRKALADAGRGMLGWVTDPQRSKQRKGLQPSMYCCMKCSCALWRHLAASPSGRYEEFLAKGVRAIRHSRDGQGRWRRWPFAYVLLILGEIAGPLALSEMRYAAKACEAELKKRWSKTNRYSLRCRSVYERVLARC